MPDNYYTKALRNSSVYELRINDDNDGGGDGDDDENAKHKSKEKKGLCCNYKKRLRFFFSFHPHPPHPFLNLFFALFSIHPVDYKYLCAQRRRKTTRVMSYVSRAGLLPSSPLLLVIVVCAPCF